MFLSLISRYHAYEKENQHYYIQAIYGWMDTIPNTVSTDFVNWEISKTYSGVGPATPLPLAGQDASRGRMDSRVQMKLTEACKCE